MWLPDTEVKPLNPTNGPRDNTHIYIWIEGKLDLFDGFHSYKHYNLTWNTTYTWPFTWWLRKEQDSIPNKCFIIHAWLSTRYYILKYWVWTFLCCQLFCHIWGMKKKEKKRNNDLTFLPKNSFIMFSFSRCSISASTLFLTRVVGAICNLNVWGLWCHSQKQSVIVNWYYLLSYNLNSLS